MTDGERDTQRAIAAAKAIFDGRDPRADFGSIHVTLEGVVSLVLLALMRGDARKAAGMLNEGLVPGVERRISGAAFRSKG